MRVYVGDYCRDYGDTRGLDSCSCGAFQNWGGGSLCIQTARGPVFWPRCIEVTMTIPGVYAKHNPNGIIQ